MTDHSAPAGGPVGLTCRLRKTATQVIPDDENFDLVLWELVDWDTGSAADLANNRLVMGPAWDGKVVVITAYLPFAGTSGSGVKARIRHYDSGDVEYGHSPQEKIDSNHGGNDGRYDITRQFLVANGDYFEVWFALDTGVSGSRTLLAGPGGTSVVITKIG